MSLRLAALGGILSYRALFAWASPAVYVSTFVVGPLFQLWFFSYLGSRGGAAPAGYYLVGNAVLAAAIAGVYGTALVMVGEREAGTLPMLLASPARRTAIFAGRAIPFVLNGVLVSAVLLAVSWLFLDLPFAPAAAGQVALAVLATSCSCAALGTALGAAGLLGRDVPFLTNLSYALLLLLSGANLPPAARHGVVGWVGQVVPVTHGVQAARAVLGYSPGGEFLPLLALELAVGLGWAMIAVAGLGWFEARARAAGSLELG